MSVACFEGFGDGVFLGVGILPSSEANSRCDVVSRGSLMIDVGRDRTDFSACVQLLLGVEDCHCACPVRELG